MTTPTNRSFMNIDMPTLLWIGDQIPGGFFIYDAGESQEIYYVNRATLRIFGCETGEEFRELTGNTFRGLVYPEDYEEIQSSIEAQIADEANMENIDAVEYRIIRKDGEIRWVDDYGHFAEMPGYGKVYYVFISDITDKKKAQEEAFRAELELEHERKMGEAKSNFLFNLSHDIRTPMNAIVGFSELARQHLGDEACAAEYLDRVKSSSDQMIALIDDMLEMNKLDSGRYELKAAPADLAAEIGRAADLFAVPIAEKRLTLIREIDLPADPVMIDALSFRRILANLIGNAVKFTPEGGTITVKASCLRAAENGFARYAFTVADTGIGMSEDFMNRMYGSFEREASSTKTGVAGTGLGLTIVRSLVDMMGGTIACESRKGEGTSFTVELPLAPAERKTGTGAERSAEPSRAAAGGRILLVEDIEINRMLAETILEEAGFLVESVPDGCDAVEAVKNSPEGYFDLVLMDIQMPIMNGYEATRAIRALKRADCRTLPIIALSANARPEDRGMSLDAGMNDHIAKPFDVTTLIACVNDRIAARKNGHDDSLTHINY